MLEVLREFLFGIGDKPLLQALIVGAFVMFVEDPTIVAAGLLVADGRLHYWSAFFGLSIGIVVGDFGLYLIGRFLGPQATRWGLLKPEHVEQAKQLINRNIYTAVAISRFLPGTRIPTFLGAGLLGAAAWRFFIIATLASMVYTWILLHVTIKVGGHFLHHLGDARGYALAVVAVVVIIVYWRKRSRARVRRMAAAGRYLPALLENRPPIIFYLPVIWDYLRLAWRYRSLSLPLLANPRLNDGGVCQNSRLRMLSLIESAQPRSTPQTMTAEPPGARDQVAGQVAALAERMRAEDLNFPVLARPDVGHRHHGVRYLRDEAALLAYFQEYRAASTILIQEIADHPFEATMLYWRRPEEERGHLASLSLREGPRRADGTPREGIPLVLPANLTDRITPALENRLNQVAAALPDFHAGLFVVRFHNLDSFLEGGDFQVVNIEAPLPDVAHLWDSRASLGQMHASLRQHLELVFEIGAANRARGERPLSARRFLREYWRFRRASAKLPAEG